MFARSKILGVTKNGRLNVEPAYQRQHTAAKKVEASLVPSDLISGGSSVNKSVNAFWQSSYQYMMTGFIPASPDLTDSQALALFYRDMYLHDSVAGSAVDIQSSFPFSDWELRGLSAEDLKIYNDSLERLSLQELFPLISVAYLTDGFFAGSLVFDYRSKQFMDVLIHDALSCEIQPSPFHNIDPKITVHTNGQTKAFLDSGSAYTNAYLRTMPVQFIELLKSDAFELDPVSTLFVARRVLTDRAYTSYLQRLLPCYLVEKVLFRGTLVEAQRRQRATTHIQAGDDTWTPTDDELYDLVQLFQSTESDPLGAYIATRNNIQVSEFRSAGDMWKWYETSESLTPMKLRSLGISDAFLSGDACLTGDTLISTEDGLKRIDSFGSDESTEWQELRIKMDSRIGFQYSTHWRYSGKKQTYKVKTARGNTLKCTANHQLLVFHNGEFSWVRTDQVKIGDLLCISPRTEHLKDSETLTPIVSIEDNGIQKVYDFSMENDPSFVANGLIVHNSYAASESAYSTFVETVAAYRSHLTDKVFYKKLFPLIAVVNELYTNDSVVKPDVNNITQFLFNANNRQALRMPKLHWHKQLEARDEQSQFEMLERVADHGIPVPITTWIAAAGLDIEALMKDLKESQDLEKKLEPFRQSQNGEEGDDSMFASSDVQESVEIPQGYHKDDQDNWTTASMKSQWAKLRRVPILSRKFTDEDNAEWDVSTNGKRHLKFHQQAARKDRLYKMAKIISKYNKDPNYRDAIIKANMKRGTRTLKGF